MKTRIENAITGDTNWSVYDVRLGVPICVYRSTEDSIMYQYDSWGRVIAVRAPLEGDTTTNPTIVRHYWDESNPSCPSVSALFNSLSGRNMRFGSIPSSSFPECKEHLWAQTHHYSSLDHNMHIVTYLFSDGFGRVAQTRKTSTIEGQVVQVASGKVEYDNMGRIILQGEPFVLQEETDCYVEPEMTETYADLSYDILDRQTDKVVWPQGYLTQCDYTFGSYGGFSTMDQYITDPRGNLTTTQSDARGLRLHVIDAMSGETHFEYDALGQCISTTDPENFTTFYSYDMLGLAVSRDHPDAGLTTWEYNHLGLPTTVTNATGDQVNMVYDAGRLTEKHYSRIGGNDVLYQYDIHGRVSELRDGSGRQQFSYDHLGNISENIRTFALPNSSQTYTFTMKYRYDSWGKIDTIVYPDGEVVKYSYNTTGDLVSMSGSKGSYTYRYIDNIEYDLYGKRTLLEYGNGTVTFYTYDNLQRLSNLTSNSLSGPMQDLEYTYDENGNVTLLENRAATLSVSGLSHIGGTFLHNYTYDALDRLVNASSDSRKYYNGLSLDMGYSPSGRLADKRDQNRHLIYGYCNDAQPHAPRRIFNEATDTLVALDWDACGNLAQLTYYSDMHHPESSRHLFWTEDNRLHTVVDDRYISYYGYDHTGERTLKLTSESILMTSNADEMTFGSGTVTPTLYASPYLVATDKGYTKHYYAGSERVCAKLGSGGLVEYGDFLGYDYELTDAALNLYEDCVKDAFVREPISDGGCQIDTPDGSNNAPIGNELEPVNAHIGTNVDMDLKGFDLVMGYNANDNRHEEESFFYHSDHLGSASWITDKNGIPVQHLMYMPFGESYVDEHTSYQERFTFTGKETDCETGYSYFGARYYDPTLLTSWTAVDPMADKYPSLSPYNYCAWNPMKFVDPDGDTISMSREAWLVQEQAFLSVFDKKKENIPFAYDEATSQMYYTGGNDSYQYSEAQNTIIDNYKSLCESEYHAKVHVVDNDQEIMTTNGATTLSEESLALGMTVNHGDNTADIYISSHPLYKLNGKIMRQPQKEDYQSIAILHEIGGHAFNYSCGVTGDINNSNTTDFENLCRSIFRGKYGSKDIRRGKASNEH